LRKLVAIIDELANARGSLTLGELFSELLDRTGYLKYLSSLEGLRGARFSNVASFYKMATSFEERNPAAGLEEFLSYMDAAMTAAASASPLGSETDSVQIMTVHQAKGLEFPLVFVVNLGPGAFPLKFRSANLGYDERFGLFARRLPQDVPTVRYEGGYGVGIEERLRETHYLEENRIMYVAMTRAKDLLYLTTPVPKDGASDYFFQLIEEFASEGGGESVALATPVTAAASIPTPEKEAAAHIGIEEIKEIAAEAVQRVSRLLPGRYAPDAGGTIGLSYSRLALFRRCPMKYALRYLYNLPLAPHEESEDESHPFDGVNASLLGTLLHRTLMQYHGARKGGVKADAPEIFAELCRAHRCPKNMVQTGNAMIERYLATPLSEVETLYEEKEFHWRMEEDSRQIMFEGKVDRVHREGGSLKVVDYKTGMRDEKSHPLQLAMYRLAIESVLGEEGILTSNFYLSTGEEVEYRFSTDELREIRDGIIEDARKIAGGDFGVDVKGEHRARDCADCGYESFCPFKGENV
jgi:ATP-dependent exoDNAse (exonuclease V) beta subunit